MQRIYTKENIATPEFQEENGQRTREIWTQGNFEEWDNYIGEKYETEKARNNTREKEQRKQHSEELGQTKKN